MRSLPAQALETLALQLLDPGLDAVLRLVVLIVLIQRQPAEGALIQQSLQITPSSTASWYAGCIAGAVIQLSLQVVYHALLHRICQ